MSSLDNLRADRIRDLGDDDLAQLVNRLDPPLMVALRTGVTTGTLDELRTIAAAARIEHRRRQTARAYGDAITAVLEIAREHLADPAVTT